MKQVVIYTICMGALLSSCNIYKKYNRPDVDMEGLYRDPVSVNDTLVSDTTNTVSYTHLTLPTKLEV